eukprot:m.128087 g.128087  ORF g.128087 m.128087 type:complete len:95 (+) comp23578_c0_seq2:121-405(+)
MNSLYYNYDPWFYYYIYDPWFSSNMVLKVVGAKSLALCRLGAYTYDSIFSFSSSLALAPDTLDMYNQPGLCEAETAFGNSYQGTPNEIRHDKEA